MTRTRHDEEALQERCVTYLLYMYSRLMWNHCPNEGKRSPRTGAVLKRMGMRPGWPDLDIYDGTSVVHIEFKTEKGRQSPAQKLMQTLLEKIGHRYYIVRSYEDFQRICREQFGPETDPDVQRLRELAGT